jgi:prolyl-tRNA editing enzyme YbaK/EbsC (Cys-tRNA(Pro) deacylase)
MEASRASAVERVTTAARQHGVEIEVVTLDQSTRTAQEAAAAVGAQVGQIVKSLVFVSAGDGKPRPYLALVSGSNLADLARLAGVVGEAGLRRANADEARAATGYAIGGIPPFGHGQPVRTVMDADLLSHQLVWAAAGTGNSVFAIEPERLRELAQATVAPIGRPVPES